MCVCLYKRCDSSVLFTDISKVRMSWCFLFQQKVLKAKVHPKIEIVITYLPSSPNMNEFLFSVEHKRRYFEECR